MNYERTEAFLELTKIQSTLSRSLEGPLNGLGLSDFFILHTLSTSPDHKMRRIDLAAKVGLTPSGVTRQLSSMEKIGLVAKEVNESDARSSLVILAAGGKQKLEEALPYAERFFTEKFSALTPEEEKNLLHLCRKLSGIYS